MALSDSLPSKKKVLNFGCSCLGWSVFLLIFAAILVLGYRIWFYSDKLRRGQIIDIPAFAARLTTAGDKTTISSVYIEPEIVNGIDEPSLGNDQDAKLTIVEFGDFQCPYTKEASVIVRSLMTRHAGQVRFIYRDYPIAALHPSAEQASQAAECAREQRKFWPYHDKLYANQSTQGLDDLLRFGEEIGLDMAQFERCVVDGRYRDLVRADIEAAAKIGISGTPTFFFNGQRIEGVIPEDIFERIIQTMLR